MSAARKVTAGFALATLLALWLADLSAPRPDPWLTLAALGQGLLYPDLSDPMSLASGAVLTLAFALCGVGLGAAAGLLLAPLYHLRGVRLFCIAIRALHELFWALLLMNITGLSPLTGVLAIGLPYTGIFAKVFSEYLEEAGRGGEQALPRGLPVVTRLLWARFPAILPQAAAYTLYRLECGLRSSAVLGFIGLPTLGFQLETWFRQAHYDRAVVVLGVFFLLILPIRHWARWRLMPVYLLASLWALSRVEVPPMGSGALARFLTDIVPAPVHSGHWASWLDKVFVQQAWPGVVETMVLGQLALVLASVLAALAFPAIVPRVAGRIGAALGHGVLVLFRSTPEYMLAFLFLQILGPSMLPAVLALGLHNGAIIAHLLGRQANTLPLRPDAPRGLTLWGWELLPRLAPNFRALCLYRWEIILRESAIMGVLGLGTLGFYVQKNVEELRLDRVMALLLVTVLLTVAVDALSRRLRARLQPGSRVHIEGARGQG